nr:hypothetical protein Iba_scaffold259CG0410 [Ipomoea batatas]
MGVVTTSQEAKKKTKSKTSVTKGASVQTTNDVSTSKAPESSKGPAQEKKKRKPPKKRKGEPSKRPSKRPKKTPKPSIAVTETLETSHEHFDDNDVLPIDLEVVVSTSNLPLLTPKEDAETAALASNVLPPPLLIHDDYSDEDDKTSSSTWTEESSAGEDDLDDEAESIHQRTQAIIPNQLTERIALPVREVEEIEVQAVQAEDSSSTLPQEPANAEEVEDVIEAEEIVVVQPHNKETEALPIPTITQTLQINVDAELAKQIAHEKLFNEMPTREDIFRTKLKRIKDKGREMNIETSDPKEQERADLNMIARVTSISRIQSSFRDIRPGVGTSRENEVPEDCEQQKEDEDKEPEKETSVIEKRGSPSLARDGNQEASRGANHEDLNPRTAEVDTRELAKTQQEQFDYLKKAIKQWSIKELQLIINHLSDQDNEALKDDTNKGKRECANLKVKAEVIEETRMIKMAEEVMVKEGLKGTSQEKLS